MTSLPAVNLFNLLSLLVNSLPTEGSLANDLPVKSTG
jgi:hypothetical protein